MARVVNAVTIDGPVEQVFDIVTTTRYWPEWHPATIGVGGVVDRPVATGDIIHERARIGGHEYEGNWTVVEHVRPTRVVLRGEGGRIQIAYAFASDGATTRLTRELEFEPDDFRESAPQPAALVALMHQQSEEALGKLKQLVEQRLSAPRVDVRHHRGSG